MDIDPMEMIDEGAGEKHKDDATARLNTKVAATVAILATFMAICEIKKGALDQDMQAAQIEKNDTWAWYQARNIRQEVMDTSARQLEAIAVGQPQASREAMLAEAVNQKKSAQSQRDKMEELKTTAKNIESSYEVAKRRGDQFDYEAASLSIAISLLAMTALTRVRRLYFVALVPIALGGVMGIAAFLGV